MKKKIIGSILVAPACLIILAVVISNGWEGVAALGIVLCAIMAGIGLGVLSS